MPVATLPVVVAGALPRTRWGEDESTDRLLHSALEDLDPRLPAGTQVGSGEQYPLHDAYDGTQVNDLRGDDPRRAGAPRGSAGSCACGRRTAAGRARDASWAGRTRASAPPWP